MAKIIEFLKGKKTYLVAIVGILSAVVAYLNGSIDVIGLGSAILQALGISALRAGVSNTGA